MEEDSSWLLLNFSPHKAPRLSMEVTDSTTTTTTTTEDSISYLPKDLQLHILSFLPITNAVQTTILSRKWKNLWTFIASFHFNDTTLHVMQHIVDQLQSVRDFLSTPIDKVSVSCERDYESWTVEEWVRLASVLNAKEYDFEIIGKATRLFLDHNGGRSAVPHQLCLPPSFSACTSIVTLKLNVSVPVKVPESIWFPSMKTLHLKSVKFRCNKSAKQLLSSSSILEELVLESCVWNNMYVVDVTLLSLERLVVNDPCPDPGSGRSPCNCNVIISAPKLLLFEYNGYFGMEYHVLNAEVLGDASIDLHYVWSSWWTERHVMCLRSLFRGIAYAKDLKLSDRTLVTIFYVPNFSPTFYHLKNVVLTWVAHPNCIIALLGLLNDMPQLQSLLFAEGVDIDAKHLESQTIPSCLLSEVKAITIKRFNGNVQELEFVKFLLKNAKALETMTVVSSEQLFKDSNKHMEVGQKLVMLPMSSRRCVITFTI